MSLTFRVKGRIAHADCGQVLEFCLGNAPLERGVRRRLTCFSTLGFCFVMPPHFGFPRARCLKKSAPKNLSYGAKRSSRCPHQRFQLCGNVSFVSLNIRFLAACKFSKLRASVAASLKRLFRSYHFAITSELGAGLSELNVK